MGFAQTKFFGRNVFSVALRCYQSLRVSQLKLENAAKTCSYTQLYRKAVQFAEITGSLGIVENFS